ncbi:MAG: flavodoxin family protein [Emcibacter sp.]|nr:flavodoxin family protein [Emcibacter sp.]
MINAANILVINGSYRDDGITDQTIEIMVQSIMESGARADVVYLRDYPIGFCLNCRECTQTSGVLPGKCVQQDGMEDLISRIEQASAYIIASPTNFGSVTAIFKRFMERLVVYAYWPWDNNFPEYRKDNSLRKKAVLVSSCAAPGFLGRWLYGTHKQLKMTARIIGADVVGTLFTGRIAKDSYTSLPESVQKKAKTLAIKLI